MEGEREGEGMEIGRDRQKETGQTDWHRQPVKERGTDKEREQQRGRRQRNSKTS
jgi:hypothetical protein